MKFKNIFLVTFFCSCISISQAYNSYGGVESTAGDIPVAIISDNNAEVLRATFDHAIAVANTDLSIPLKGTQEVISYGNSLQAYGRLCNLMKDGIGAVFGPSAKHTARHLLAVCDIKDVPFIHSRMSQDAEGFNLHPHPLDISKAIRDLIDAFGWTRFIFLYQSSEYLPILNNIIDMYSAGGPVISVMRYDLKLNGNYKSVLRRVRKSTDSRLLVVGSRESVAELLRQAQQIGIMNEDYSYIIGNLDLHTYDVEEYKYSEANITGFRMFSPEQLEVKELIKALTYADRDHYNAMHYAEEEEPEIVNNGSCPVSLEMALTYDAIQVVAEATKHLIYSPQSLNCSEKDERVQEDGSTFKNYMRSLDMNEKLLTGRIYFEGHVRKGYTFDIIELQETGLVKVGTWSEQKNITIERQPQIPQLNGLVDNSLVNKTFKVLISVPNKPYASLVESHDRLVGNSQYEGYSIDLIKELASLLGFNFTFINGGNDYGSFNKTTNVTTGMLKEIVEGRADLAITDLTITSEREEAVDFSIPFMNLGIAILFLKPKKADPALLSFMDPFSSEVWVYLGVAYVGVSLILFVLGRLSPMEWDNPYPCIEEPEVLENQFTLNNSFWFTTGALLQQGSEIAPKALSTRTLASIWWFFTLIIVSSYTANLAAFLTFVNPQSAIDSVQDLAENKGGVQYGAKRTGSTRKFFLTSEDDTYKAMNEYLTNNPHLLTETNQEGVDMVTKSRNSVPYAFLMESTSIEFNIVRECDLMKVGDPLDEKGYGIAMIKNWPYRDKFNNALLELQEQGVLAKLKTKWWNEVGAGVCGEDSSSDVNPLDWANLGGVFFVLVFGCAVSFIFVFTAWCFMVIRKSRHFDVSFADAFVEEIKIVFDFRTYERELKDPASVYSRRNSLMSIDSLESESQDNESETRSDD